MPEQLLTINVKRLSGNRSGGLLNNVVVSVDGEIEYRGLALSDLFDDAQVLNRGKK